MNGEASTDSEPSVNNGRNEVTDIAAERFIPCDVTSDLHNPFVIFPLPVFHGSHEDKSYEPALILAPLRVHDDFVIGAELSCKVSCNLHEHFVINKRRFFHLFLHSIASEPNEQICLDDIKFSLIFFFFFIVFKHSPITFDLIQIIQSFAVERRSKTKSKPNQQKQNMESRTFDSRLTKSALISEPARISQRPDYRQFKSNYPKES
jgi:hypothetical protein